MGTTPFEPQRPLSLPDERSKQAYQVRRARALRAVAAQDKTFFLISVIAHVGILAFFIIGLSMSSQLRVFENTNQHDVISAVVLGDTAKSKVLTERSMPPPVPVAPALPKEPTPTPVAPEPKPKAVVPDKDVIALKPTKKVIPPKPNFFANDLLADIKKVNKQKTKQKQAELQKQFQKTLRKQAELSLRQQLLNEDIKLKGTEAHFSQGVVDKYTALILQAIAEHWLVPTQAKKKLSARLLIRLAPGGNVLDVKVTRSSGDPSLDSSARAAVLKASPLPVPSKSDDFEPFRQFELNAKPENIMTTSR